MKNSMQDNSPLVSIVIPCRNEEKYIRKCLDSITVQNYPEDKLEVLAIDGMSEGNRISTLKSRFNKNYGRKWQKSSF